MDGLRIRARTEEDDDGVVHLLNRLDPDFPPTTVEEVRRRRETEPKDLLIRRWVGDLEREIVVVAGLFELRTAEPGRFYATISVAPERWGRGIGSRMFSVLLDEAGNAGCARLYGTVAENRPAALDFVRRRGLELTGKGERLSRLDVHRANLEGFTGVEERLTQQGIRIETLADLQVGDETLLHRLYLLDSATHLDIPSSERFAEDPYEEWLARAVHGPGRSPEWHWIAMHGDRPVGVSRLQRQGPNAAWNAYTGVDREYRGKGIARALKLRTIEWSRQNGVDFIYTGNEAENERMLSINVALGYQMLPRDLEVVKYLSDSESATRR